MASDATTQVTGEAGDMTTLLAATANCTDIFLVNESGAQVDLYTNSQTQRFDYLEASGPDKRKRLTGSICIYKLEAKCHAPLSVLVTAIV